MPTRTRTRDSMCLLSEDRLFTGDTLLIGATGRTDLPSGDAGARYDSLFEGILRLDPALKVFPAQDYKRQGSTTIATEMAKNPRLQKRDRAEFMDRMEHLNISMPTHLTEALRTNMTGGKTVAQMLASAAARTPFLSLRELGARVERREHDLIVLDVREEMPSTRDTCRGRVTYRAGSSSCVSTRNFRIRRLASLPCVNSARSRLWRRRRCVDSASCEPRRWTAA